MSLTPRLWGCKAAEAVPPTALQSLLNIGTAGAGIGAGARSLSAILNWFKARPSSDFPESLTIGVPVKVPRRKRGQQPDLTDAQVDDLTTKMGGVGFDQPATVANPAWAPLVIPAGVGGVAGGWKLMDYILDARRKQELSEDLEGSRDDYAKALVEQYGPLIKKNKEPETVRMVRSKIAADLAELSKRVFDKAAAEPAGNWYDSLLPQNWGPVNKATNTVLSGALTTGSTAALATGIPTWLWLQKRREDAVTDKAIKERRRRQAEMDPAPFYAVPVPIGEDK